MSEVAIIGFIFSITSLLIAVIGHEIMHGYIALKCGDTTALYAGRLTINPIKHIDLLGSIVLPILLAISGAPFLFGWAKPVPVDMRMVLHNKGYDGAIGVALAGIAYNFVLAIIASLLLCFVWQDGLISAFLTYLITINIVLAIFNLWPIPPLDGSNALGFALMKFGANNLGRKLLSVDPRVGMVIVMIVIATPLSNIVFAPAKIIINILI